MTLQVALVMHVDARHKSLQTRKKKVTLQDRVVPVSFAYPTFAAGSIQSHRCEPRLSLSILCQCAHHMCVMAGSASRLPQWCALRLPLRKRTSNLRGALSSCSILLMIRVHMWNGVGINVGLVWDWCGHSVGFVCRAAPRLVWD